MFSSEAAINTQMIEKFTIWLSEKVIDSLKKQSTNAQFPLYLSPGVAAVQRGQKLGLIHLPLGFPSNEIAFCREWGLKKTLFFLASVMCLTGCC